MHIVYLCILFGTLYELSTDGIPQMVPRSGTHLVHTCIVCILFGTLLHTTPIAPIFDTYFDQIWCAPLNTTRIVCILFGSLFAQHLNTVHFDHPLYAFGTIVHYNMLSLYTIQYTIGHSTHCTHMVHLCILFSTLSVLYPIMHQIYCTQYVLSACIYNPLHNSVPITIHTMHVAR